MKKLIFTCIAFVLITNVSAQLKVNSAGNVGIGTTTPSTNLDVVGTTQTEQLLVSKPVRINNWNNLWQSCFIDSDNADNAPESSWFWGINMGHQSNNPNYRYGGQIAIRNSNDNPALYFRSTNINGEGTWAKVLHSVGLQNINGALKIVRTGDVPYAAHEQAIDANALAIDGRYIYGIKAYSIAPQPLNGGRAYGVYGAAGNSTTGYNYGVLGTLSGTQDGAGIYGAVNSTIGAVPGRFAGYFEGNVRVTGVLMGILLNSSDIRYKQNITDLNKKEVSTLNNLLKLKPIEYNFNQIYPEEAKSDTATAKRGLYDEKSQVFQKKHYGLVAQELQKLYPDLVYEEDNGYLAVNYIEIIPLLIQSIQELHREVEQLKNTKAIEARNAFTDNDSSTDVKFAINSSVPVLYQNIPNPFNRPLRKIIYN